MLLISFTDHSSFSTSDAIRRQRSGSTSDQVMAVAWRHQAITWTSGDLSSVRSNDSHLKANLQEIPQTSVTGSYALTKTSLTWQGFQSIGFVLDFRDKWRWGVVNFVFELELRPLDAMCSKQPEFSGMRLEWLSVPAPTQRAFGCDRGDHQGALILAESRSFVKVHAL